MKTTQALGCYLLLLAFWCGLFVAADGACVTKSDVISDVAVEEMDLLRNPHPGDAAWEGRRAIVMKRYDAIFPPVAPVTTAAAVTSR